MQKTDNKVPLIYISGWKGNGRESSSYKWLERYFKNTECYAAGGQTDVEKMVSDLQGIIDMCQSKYGRTPILVGNSYGGFLASLFPQTQVLLNPALFPAESLQHIADLTEEEIERFRQWQDRRLRFNRHRLRKNIFSVCTECDELIPDHRTETVSLNPAVMIPGGAHRLSDDQRDQYVLPLLMNLVKPDFRIVRISLEEPQRLLTGNAFKAMTRRFPTSFDSFESAATHLERHLRRNRSQKSTIGYLIVEMLKFEKQHALHQWSFDSEGRLLADACMDCTVAFKGRDTATLPFHKGEYVIAYWCGDLALGVIEAEPYTPQKVYGLIKTSKYKKNFLDSSDDCYLVDFTDAGYGSTNYSNCTKGIHKLLELNDGYGSTNYSNCTKGIHKLLELNDGYESTNYSNCTKDIHKLHELHEGHGHPCVASVFPLPFSASEISDEVKDSLCPTSNHNSKK